MSRPTAVRAQAAPLALLTLFIGWPLVACQRPAAPAWPPLRFEPQSGAFELPYGGEVSEDFWLAAGGKGASVPGWATSLQVEGPVDPDLSIEPLPPRPGSGPGLRIRAAGRRVGVRAGTLQVVPRPGPARPLPLLYALRVRGTLTVVPSNPLVDLRAAEPAAAITVRDTQPDFALRAAEISRGPFAATMARDPASGSYLVRVTVVPDRFPAGDRGATGTLVLHSNDRVEPRKEVPLFAFGRAP